MEPRLSRREQEVLSWLLQGKSNQQIALSLGVAERTIEFHLKNIYAKFQVSSRVELILKLRQPAPGSTEKLWESTVVGLEKRTHNGEQSTLWQRWTQPLKNILFTCQQEFAMLKSIISEDVSHFLKTKLSAKSVLFWIPRIIGFLFAAFLSLFALDVFNEQAGLGETLLALSMHLIPTLLVVLVLAIAWRRDWLGMLFFTSLAGLYLVWSRRLDWSLVISGPLLLIGLLFLLNWFYARHFRRIAH